MADSSAGGPAQPAKLSLFCALVRASAGATMLRRTRSARFWSAAREPAGASPGVPDGYAALMVVPSEMKANESPSSVSAIETSPKYVFGSVNVTVTVLVPPFF